MNGKTICLAACMMFMSAAAAIAQDDRIGFAEEFDSVDGWKVTSGGVLEGMKAEDGIAVFDTYIGGFQTVRLPDQPVVDGRVYVSKEYGQEVDLDKFHYIVMDVTQKNMLTILYVEAGGRRCQTHVAASTGMSVQDVAPLGLKGKHKIKFNFKIVNTGGVCKVDYIRFVSRLTEKEQGALIASPIVLYEEGIKGHPYQKLEALWQRAPRPWNDLPGTAQEMALFRDVGTGMPTWRLTATPAHEGINGTFKPNVWRPDGSSISTPRRTYLFEKDTWDARGGTAHTPRDYVPPAEKVEPLYQIVDDKANRKIVFKRLKPKLGEDESIYEHPYPTKPYYYGAVTWIRGNRLIAAFRGAEAILVSPDETDPKKRVRVTPMLYFKDDKGCHISDDGRYISLSTPFGSYHNYTVDLVEQTHFPGASFTQSHGCGGSPWRIMSYGETGKVTIHDDAFAPRNYTPGKNVRVYGVWLGLISTDYGEMTQDSRYGITNGMKGELGDQYVLFDRLDAGTILRLCTYNVSYETWDLRAKVSASRDYTKLAYASDMLGDADIYMTLVRRPDSPVGVKAGRTAGGVKVTWGGPVNHAEIRGYHVYRSTRSGQGYERITTQPLAATEFVDANAPAGKPVFYAVTSAEYSGLMSVFSEEVGVDAKDAPVILHYEAEGIGKAAPMRDVVDGYASNWRAVRVTPVRMGEDVGTLSVTPNIAKKGNYTVWGRCRQFRDDTKGTLSLKVAGKEAGRLSVSSGAWTWLQLGSASFAPGEKLDLASADDGVMVDKIILTDVADYTPKTADDRDAPPATVTGLKAAKTTANSIELNWDTAAERDIYCWSVYVGDNPDFTPSNETLLCSTKKPIALDWGIPAGRTYYYRVVAIDQVGHESAPATIEARTEALDARTISLSAVDAKASAGLVKGDGYVEYPGKDAGEQSLTFAFDVPADGTYRVWTKYTPTFNQGYSWDSVGLQLDDGQVTPEGTRPRPPRGQGAKAGRWFVERMMGAQRLSAGKHTLTVRFADDDKLRSRMGQRIADVWITNDEAFVPPDYTAQVMFSKPAPWAR